MAEKTAEPRSAQAANDDVAQADLAASQLSAMVDGELADAETDLALRRLCKDRHWQGRWERYHLISDALQGHLPAALDADFAPRLLQAIDREPLLQPAARTLPAWYKPVTGFALAASVALAALVGLQLSRPDVALTPGNPVATAPAVATPLPAQIAVLDPPADAADEPAEARLNSYLVNHNGHASRSSVNGMLPYVRMVGYQTNR